jgi:F-type H+-transporting ATPase subunit a
MGEHQTWFDFLYSLPGWANLSAALQQQLGRTSGLEQFPTHWTLTPVLGALLVALLVVYGALRFRASVARGGDAAIVPPPRFGLRNLFEMLTDAIYSTMVGVMGEDNARRFLPFIGSLAVFILFSNLLAIVPGFAPPTDTLKTNLALAVIVFVVYQYHGIKEHGVGYIKHFFGPLPVLAPLMFVIEIISHIARPVSLALRLMGNMAADHKVVFAFFSMVPLLVPVPFLLLGILVCIVQTLVFCLLSMVYLSMAIAHDH